MKTNLGHLDVAAGVTGLIKIALSLHHKIIPASLHFTKPNPKLDLENSPFYVNATLQEWKTNPECRAAPASARSAPAAPTPTWSRGSAGIAAFRTIAPVAAAGVVGQDARSARPGDGDLAEHLRRRSSDVATDAAATDLADAAFTLQTGRSEFVHRRIVACRDPADGAAALEARDPKRVFTHQQQLKEPPVVFMFPGQGAQYAGMGAELYRSEPVFRAEVDRCARSLQPILETDLRTLLFPRTGRNRGGRCACRRPASPNRRCSPSSTRWRKLWMSWGIRPAAMIGHSVGEYVAGCLAGVFSLEDALRWWRAAARWCRHSRRERCSRSGCRRRKWHRC